MNAAHAHLLLNHLPVLGTAFGVLLMLLAFVRKSDELKRVGLGVFVAAALSAAPAYFTGESAEDSVEERPGISKAMIHEHENTAEGAAVALAVLGAVSLAGLVRFRRAACVPNWLSVSSLALAIVVAVLMARTAGLGGRIQHPEIRPSDGVAQPESD
jgi:uncharacterized membrane protein